MPVVVGWGAHKCSPELVECFWGRLIAPCGHQAWRRESQPRIKRCGQHWISSWRSSMPAAPMGGPEKGWGMSPAQKPPSSVGQQSQYRRILVQRKSWSLQLKQGLGGLLGHPGMAAADGEGLKNLRRKALEVSEAVRRGHGGNSAKNPVISGGGSRTRFLGHAGRGCGPNGLRQQPRRERAGLDP